MITRAPKIVEWVVSWGMLINAMVFTRTSVGRWKLLPLVTLVLPKNCFTVRDTQRKLLLLGQDWEWKTTYFVIVKQEQGHSCRFPLAWTRTEVRHLNSFQRKLTSRKLFLDPQEVEFLCLQPYWRNPKTDIGRRLFSLLRFVSASNPIVALVVVVDK